MIVELNTKLLEKEDININQLVFLSLVLNKNQKYNQDVRNLISKIDDVEIQELVSKKLITSIERGNTITYKITDKLKQDIIGDDDSWFDKFYNLYPIYVLRPDGTKGFLRGNINKCRSQYNSIVGNSEDTANRIYDALKFQIEHYTNTGKLSYFKTMWNWITKHEWEAIEDEMNYESTPTNTYGTELV